MELTKTSFRLRFKHGPCLCMYSMCMFVRLCLFMCSAAGCRRITLHGIYKSPFAIGVDSKLVQASVASIWVIQTNLFFFFLGACWALYCRPERAASSDSFVVSSDRVDLFMSLILYAASLKARATDHRDFTALDRVSHYKALTLIFDWQQPTSNFRVSAAMKSRS